MQTDTTLRDASRSTKLPDPCPPTAIVSFNRYDQADTFDDAQQIVITASYYEGQELKGVKFPPPGPQVPGPINLPRSLLSDNPINACFRLETYGARTNYWQPVKLPFNPTDRPLKSSWMGTLPDPEGDGKSERMFAAGFQGGSTNATQQDGKPDWLVLGVRQRSTTARSLLRGKGL